MHMLVNDGAPRVHHVHHRSRSVLAAVLILTGMVLSPDPDALASVVRLLDAEEQTESQPAETVIPGLALLQGVPIDFRYFAETKYGPPEESAVKKALEDLKSPKNTNESISPGNYDVILRLPSLYATTDGIDPRERIPEEWYPYVTKGLKTVGQVVRSVGRIEVRHLTEGRDAAEIGFIAGTGFVVAPGIIMTNRHVVDLFANIDNPQLPFKQDPKSGQSAVVYINFSGTYGEEDKLFRIDKVLYVHLPRSAPPDVALLQMRLKPGEEPPPPLKLQNIPPSMKSASRRVLVSGYPTRAKESDIANRAGSYFRTLRVKRLSLGELLGEEVYFDGAYRLFHNCTTLGGSSGSPLVDLETGTVWGLHFKGWFTDPEGEGNKAEPMWRICALPEIQKYLGAAATEPVAVPSSVLAAPPVRRRPRSPLPVLRLVQDDIAPGQHVSSRWPKPDSLEYAHLRRSLPSVGLVEGNFGPLGTAFMIRPGVAITTQIFSEDADPKTLTITFSHEPLQEPSLKFPVRVLHRSPFSGVTLLAVDAAVKSDLPPPLPLQIDDPGNTIIRQPSYVVAYTFQDRNTPPAVFSAIFPPPYGNKRLSFCQVMGFDTFAPGIDPINAKHVIHDCNTAAGSGGAPLLSVSSGKVLGIHRGGQYLVANYALPMWSILQDPVVQQILASAGE